MFETGEFMDFGESGWSDAKILTEKNTKILVIDFVNRTCLFSAEVNNYEAQDPEITKNFHDAVTLCIKNMENSPRHKENIKKSA